MLSYVQLAQWCQMMFLISGTTLYSDAIEPHIAGPILAQVMAARQHQSITWTNVDKWPARFYFLHQNHKKCSKYRSLKWVWKLSFWDPQGPTCSRKVLWSPKRRTGYIAKGIHSGEVEWNFALQGPLTRYVKLRVAHAPGVPGTFSPPRTLKETAI